LKRPAPQAATMIASSAAGMNGCSMGGRPFAVQSNVHSRTVVPAAPTSPTPSATSGQGRSAYAATAYSSTGNTIELGNRTGGAATVPSERPGAATITSIARQETAHAGTGATRRTATAACPSPIAATTPTRPAAGHADVNTRLADDTPRSSASATASAMSTISGRIQG